jgi:3-oxoacyl-[acyl-carrier protein] reductase
MDVQGKVIVITGAAQGIGRKMAEIMAGQGAKLALVDVDHTKLQNTVRLCTKLGGKVKDYPADVIDEPAVEALFSSVHKDFGSVDGLINNAGISSDALLVKAADGKVQRKMSLTDFHRVIAVDLRGVFLCAREAAVHMIEGGRSGVIINISSISRRQCRADQLRRRQGRRRCHDGDLGQGTRALPYPRRRHRAGI